MKHETTQTQVSAGTSPESDFAMADVIEHLERTLVHVAEDSGEEVVRACGYAKRNATKPSSTALAENSPQRVLEGVRYRRGRQLIRDSQGTSEMSATASRGRQLQPPRPPATGTSNCSASR